MITGIRMARGIAFLYLVSASAFAQFLPPKWNFVVGGSGGIDERNGYATCQEAGLQGLESARRIHVPAEVIVLDTNCPDPTQTSSPNTIWQYRLSTSFPTSPSQTVTIQGYCDNWGGSAASHSSENGFFCHPASAAVVKNIGDCKTCVANPIFPLWGNKMQREVDYVGSGPFPLRFERVHNTAPLNFLSPYRVDRPGIGANWWHIYHRRLTFTGPNAATVTIVGADRPDGQVHAFNLSGAVYVGEADVDERLQKLAAGWKLTTRDDEIELYDEQGKLLSIANRAGLAQTLSYFTSGPNSGLLERVTDAFGKTLSFEYNDRQRISAVVDPAGGRYLYTYTTEGQNNLASVTYPDTTVRQYRYESAASAYRRMLTSITDENGSLFATFDYGDSNFGRVTLSERAGGAGKVTVSYANPREVTTHVSAALSATRNYSFQPQLGVYRSTSIAGPACPSCGPASQTYDANGNVATSVDWNGNRTNYAYELARNLETLRTEALTSAGATTPQTRSITTAWHASFRLPAQIAEPFRIMTNTYDAAGNLLSKSLQATTDASGAAGFGATPSGAPRAWIYTYNANGSVLTMDGPRTEAADVTTYTYYPNNDADLGKRGNVAAITNAAGHVTSITAYNAHGQPLTIVDPNGLITTLTYDLRQRLTSRNVDGELTTYTYDNAGQLTKVTLPDASFLSYSYDAAHRLTDIQDNLGNRIAYTLDFAGNRTQEQVFDPANALAQTRSRVISNINRLFQEVGAAGQTTEYAYDNQGNVTSVKDPLNHLTSNQYDALNRLKQATDPNLGVTQYGYNGLDALTQVTDPRNLVTGYTVDGLGNLNQQASPDTGNTANAYDAAGNLLTQTDAKGQVTAYVYDALNRVTLITFHDGSKQAYAYDQGANGFGRLASINETNPANQQTSLIVYGYDQKGRVTSETRTVNGVAYTLAHAYDGSGRLTGMTYPSGRAVAYTLDALGRVAQVTTTKDSQSLVVVQNVQYHPFGGAKSWTLGNGQIYSRTVDQDGRIASYTLGAANYTIGFDAASRITAIGANTYGYDSLDRLSSAILPSSNFAYGYDAVGNRLTKTIGANTDTYTYGSTSNRIASLTPFGSPLRSFTFDANGSTTSDGLNTYAYDTRGRMVQAVSTAGTTSYQVNALEQRIRKSNGSGDTIFTYDTWGKLIAESDPGGSAKREYIYLGDIPVMVWQ